LELLRFSGGPAGTGVAFPKGVGLKKKLGEILVRYYRVPAAAVDAALASQHDYRARLGEALVRDGALGEDDLVRALAYQHGLPAVFQISTALIDGATLASLPSWLVAWEQIVPVARTQGRDDRPQLVVATAEPRSRELVAELEKHAHCSVQLVLTRPDEILSALKRFYTGPAALHGGRAVAGEEHEPTALSKTVPGSPVIEWETATGAGAN